MTLLECSLSLRLPSLHAVFELLVSLATADNYSLGLVLKGMKRNEIGQYPAILTSLGI